MRILFLSAALPMAWGAEVRAFRFLDYLARGHDVDLAAFDVWSRPRPPRDLQPELLAFLRARCRDVTVMGLPAPATWSNLLCNSISEEPFLIAGHRSESMRDLIAERVSRGRYDMVWTNGLAMTQYAAGLPLPTILDAGGCAARRYLRLSRLPQHLPRRTFYRSEAARLLAYEARLLPAFTRCLVTSMAERDDLWQIAPAAAIQVLPNTLELARLHALPPSAGRVAPAVERPARPPRLAFLGDLHSPADRDAAHYLCRRILPRVRRVLPQAELLVIGPGHRRCLRTLGQLAGVRVTGPVADYQAALSQVVGVVCPLRANTGFPVHVVEAMACGKPVIATPLVVDSLGLRPNDPILIAGSAGEFAHRAAALLQHPHIAESLGGRCRQLVLERFDIRTITARLDDILEHLVPQPRRHRSGIR